jgi:signal transduction histidine kinase
MKRLRRVPLGVEVVLAFVAGGVAFPLVAVTIVATGSGVLAVVVGVACIVAVVAIARRPGIVYASPVAIASLLAFDWFLFPPTHPHAIPNTADLADLGAYLLVAVLVGELAAYAGRSADISEAARTELLSEQAALRRVATLVARGGPPDAIFPAVAEEVGILLEVDGARVIRHDGGDQVTQLPGWSAPGFDPPPVGRTDLGDTPLAAEVLRTGRAARIDDYARVFGVIPPVLRQMGIRSSVGAPIIVDGRLWGVMLAWLVRPVALPETTEARLADFTELIATAVSNSASREALARLAEEQAALRRVATLVAQGVPRSVLFGAVAQTVGRLLGADRVEVVRGVDVRRDGDPPDARAPIVVDGRAWGVLLVHAKPAEPLPADTESRLANFTELVATAISNAQARAEVHRLADEQAALRRVATLVASEPGPDDVFAIVAEEVARQLGVDDTKLFRYEHDGTATVVADWGGEATPAPGGTRLKLEPESIAGTVLRTARPARTFGIRSAVGSPIVVDGRLWGAVVARSREPVPLPPDTESRMGAFTELLATAISNTEARVELAASRTRIVAAADAERRRVVADLHDGAQQRLVYTVITLKLARHALENDTAEGLTLVAEAIEEAEHANEALRELAHGIHPSILTVGGLRAGVEALAMRTPVTVDNGVAVGRLPPAVEATAYFVVAEALTNVAKHAHADHAAVTAQVEHGTLSVQVRDDGVGGARPDGHGLVGLADRLAALDGRLRVESPADGGTLVAAVIPVPD